MVRCFVPPFSSTPWAIAYRHNSPLTTIFFCRYTTIVQNNTRQCWPTARKLPVYVFRYYGVLTFIERFHLARRLVLAGLSGFEIPLQQCFCGGRFAKDDQSWATTNRPATFFIYRYGALYWIKNKIHAINLHTVLQWLNIKNINIRSF